jgi:magnesium chelatase family protein
MPIAVAHTRAVQGIEAPRVRIEVHLANALPSFQIVGLPETAVRESRDRVRAAIQTSGFEFPRRRITVNLAPADLPKDGGRFDLGIALGILSAAGQLDPKQLEGREFIGELGLDGQLRSVGRVLSASIRAREARHQLVLAHDDGPEAALIDGADVVTAGQLSEVWIALQTSTVLPAARPYAIAEKTAPDLKDVCGQKQARRALEIAAAGGHHLLLIGPPGSGKSMLAARLPGIMPPMSEPEALETAAIHSLHGSDYLRLNWRNRPFRSPHHTASGIALVGGGSNPRPGEISLAHNGVLFLDEMTEFNRDVLDVLREPLETGLIHLSRAARQATYPASFQLVGAMNPCPQGFACDLGIQCECSPEQRLRHRRRLSAPLLDRIDLAIEVLRLPTAALLPRNDDNETSAAVSKRVNQAYARQLERQGRPNTKLTGPELGEFAQLKDADRVLLMTAVERFQLSARSYHRVLRVARTIADLDQSPGIETGHLMEALAFRAIDRWRDPK